MIDDKIVSNNPGNFFKIIALAYNILPLKLRNSAKIGHHASVLVSKFMPGKYYIVQTPGGKMCIAANHPGDIQRAWGVWEIDLQLYIKKNLRAGDVFIDVGAHRGTYTIMASHLVGRSGKVIALEPFQDHFQCLEHTAKQSPYDNIKLLNAACGSRSGQTLFSEQGRRIADQGISVPLDSVTSSADLIKIDTDGKELDVLLGSQALIRNGTRVIVEFSDFPYQSIERLWNEACELMTSLGCKPYLILKNGTIGPVPRTFHEIKDRHVLFQRDPSSPKRTI